jgi:1,6-anhydro-N-acetylmuramate kinase
METPGVEHGLSDVDFLSTLVELTARQIAQACARFGGPHVAGGATDDVLLRGGVCANAYFVERLRAQMTEQLGTEVARITTLADVAIDEDSWENAMYQPRDMISHSQNSGLTQNCLCCCAMPVRIILMTRMD